MDFRERFVVRVKSLSSLPHTRPNDLIPGPIFISFPLPETFDFATASLFADCRLSLQEK